MTPEQMQEMFDSVGRFNEKLQADGSWVFATDNTAERALLAGRRGRLEVP